MSFGVAGKQILLARLVGFTCFDWFHEANCMLEFSSIYFYYAAIKATPTFSLPFNHKNELISQHLFPEYDMGIDKIYPFTQLCVTDSCILPRDVFTVCRRLNLNLFNA